MHVRTILRGWHIHPSSLCIYRENHFPFVPINLISWQLQIERVNEFNIFIHEAFNGFKFVTSQFFIGKCYKWHLFVLSSFSSHCYSHLLLSIHRNLFKLVFSVFTFYYLFSVAFNFTYFFLKKSIFAMKISQIEILCLERDFYLSLP